MTKEDFMKLKPSTLAAITGDFAASWVRWLKGERSPSYESLLNASQKLQMSFDDLVTALEERRAMAGGATDE